MFGGRKKKQSYVPTCEEVPAADLRQRILAKHDQMASLQGRFQETLPAGLEVGHLMTEDLTLAAPETSYAELCEIASGARTRHILVQNENGHLVGVVSDRDLASAPRRACAKSIMTTNPITVSRTTPVSIALRILLSRHISCLPVLEHDQLCGVITTTDLLMAFHCVLESAEEPTSVAAMPI